MSVNAWAHNQVKAMFKEVQKLGILNTFTPLEVVRDQQTCVRVLRCLGLGVTCVRARILLYCDSTLYDTRDFRRKSL